MKSWFVLPFLIIAYVLYINNNTVLNASEDKKMTNKVDALATFAGGCFWCMESPYEELTGVGEVISGYTGGSVKNPTYEAVSAGNSGHLEVVQIHYDSSVITFEQLLHVFWRQIDPTDGKGSFVDRGPQYRSAIFYHDDAQKQLAEQAIQQLVDDKKYNKPIATDILPLEIFYPAEEYHQDYGAKNPLRYKYYRYRSGRDQYIAEIWGKDADSLSDSDYQKPDDQSLQQQLSLLQYEVTQKDGTEPAFKNSYWDNKAAGIYVDVVSGEALFSSQDKYDSKTGWPSFYKTINSAAVREKIDQKLFSSRTEVRSQQSDSHLGHVFDDGPAPTGLRYCINSASLRFIPKNKLIEAGYPQYLAVFEVNNK